MEIKNIKTFLQIVESGSFTKAAEKLGYTQSTISFQINQLENELNCKLFEKSGRNIILTEKGKNLLKYALKLNQTIQECEDDFLTGDEISGVVQMFSSDSILEKMMILNYTKFYEKYPSIKLVFSTGSTKDMLDVLAHNETDCIFTLDNHIYDPNYIIARESPVQMNFVTNINSELVGKKLKIKDILSEKILLTEKGLSYRKVLDDHLAKMDYEITPVLETGRTDVLLRCVEEDNFITFLPDFVTKQSVEEGRIAILDIEDVDIQIWKQLIYRKDKWLSKALYAFIEFVKANEFEW